MRELARLRSQLTKLKTRTGSGHDETVALLEQSLDLTDRLRGEAAALEDRCAYLEDALGRRDANLHSLFDLLPTAIVTTDGAGIIVDANRAASALLGRSSAKLHNQLLLHFAEDREGFAGLVRKLPHAADPLQARMRFRPQERAPFEAEVLVTPDTRDSAGNWLWFLMRCEEARTGKAEAPAAEPFVG